MSASASDHIVVERTQSGVALLTIDRARHFNTLSADTLGELHEKIAELSRDGSIGAIVIRGEGGATFAAGANIREVCALTPREALRFAELGRRVLDTIESAPQLVYAAVTGFCMGGGLDLALACDIRIASPTSVFAHPGSKLGIITGFGGTARLARTVGRAIALEMFATARRIDAFEALSIGLVDTVIDDPVASAMARAESVAAMGVSAARDFKALAVRGRRDRP